MFYNIPRRSLVQSLTENIGLRFYSLEKLFYLEEHNMVLFFVFSHDELSREKNVIRNIKF